MEAQVPQNKQSQSLRSGSAFRERKQQRQRVLDLENHALTFAAEGQVDEELEPEKFEETLEASLFRPLRRERRKLVQEIALKNIR